MRTENQNIEFSIESGKTIAWDEVIACTIPNNDVARFADKDVHGLSINFGYAYKDKR